MHTEQPTTSAAMPSLQAGDDSARVNHWVAAVHQWQLAAEAGDLTAAQRLRGFLQHFGGNSLDHAKVPKRAYQALAICIESAIFGLLAAIAANQTGDAADTVLLWLAWIAWFISAIAGLVFAARSGRLDNDVEQIVAAMPIASVIAKANAIAARLERDAPASTTQASPSLPTGDAA